MQRALKQFRLDINGSQVNNLDKFIINTDVNRALYFESNKPHVPSYHLPYSVSEAATKYPERLSRSTHSMHIGSA